MSRRHDDRLRQDRLADIPTKAEEAELQILIEAEEKLTKIRDVMKPLIAHLEPLKLRYGILQWLQQQAQGAPEVAAGKSDPPFAEIKIMQQAQGTPEFAAGAEAGRRGSRQTSAHGVSRAARPRSLGASRDAATATAVPELAQEPDSERMSELIRTVHLPELRVFGTVKRPEVTLSELSRKEPLNPEALLRDIESFYNAFNVLWKAALSVDLGPEIRIRLDDGDLREEAKQDSLPVEVQARRALERVMTRNSIQGRYERLDRVLDAVRHRREVLQLWTTPEGRYKLLRDYLDRHQLTVERFAEILGCQPMTIHNWRNCKGKGLGPKQRLIEDVLRKDTPPGRIKVS
jgi:hypothetical protein